MKNKDPRIAQMVADALQDRGRISLVTLLTALSDGEKLRAIAKQHGLSPKGYRVERAPAALLATMFADSKDAEILAEVCALVLEPQHVIKASAPSKSANSAAALKRREQELEEIKVELQRCREQLAKVRDKESSWNQRLQSEEEKAARLRSEIEALHRKADQQDKVVVPADQSQRIHELEQDLDALGEADEALRRLLALRVARIRELEAQVHDLEALVPKGRRKKKVAPAAPALADGFRLPQFEASFYKSLEGKDRKSIEKAFQAIMLFCTEGPTYPGLEVKQLEGMDFWSMRASLKLRIFFRLREDGDVDFIALADREDQHTALRRLKER